MNSTRGRVYAILLCFAMALGLVANTPSVARADPGCVTNGAYVLFARGSGSGFDSGEALEFKANVQFHLSQLGMNSAWAELGNLDNSDPGEAGEYPAVPWTQYASGGLNLTGYNNSVDTGWSELVTHLNHRYGTGPGDRNCSNEVVILGGFSQGADVVSEAIRSGLVTEVRRHIAFVALYGDPRFDCDENESWVRTDCNAQYQYAEGALGKRVPYHPSDLRVGSWCDPGDTICTGRLGMDLTGATHGWVYQDSWIRYSAREAALKGLIRSNELGHRPIDPSYLDLLYSELDLIQMPVAAPPTPPPPTIHTIKRTKDHGGTNQVYAATRSAVTEAWWQPGGDGVHVKEMIHISQGNIVGFDKVNEPDGATQSLYTAVPDGVWETWWRPNEGIHSEKIVTGLSGVRQVIADPRWENGQYVHRLYLLAQDGPYEVWWKDGDASGIHVNRLTQINDPVTMTASTGPSGEYQLYVATPTWVYELWWYPGQGLHYGPVINITQADIDSLSKITFSAGQQRLYTGTSTGVWQSIWQNSAPAHNYEVSGKTGVVHSEAMKPGSAFQIYLATGTSVQEYWWTTTNAGNSTLMSRSQGDITVFDKYNDSSYQQVYTATLYGQVYETYWGGGTGPTTKLLFTVGR